MPGETMSNLSSKHASFPTRQHTFHCLPLCQQHFSPGKVKALMPHSTANPPLGKPWMCLLWDGELLEKTHSNTGSGTFLLAPEPFSRIGLFSGSTRARKWLFTSSGRCHLHQEELRRWEKHTSSMQTVKGQDQDTCTGVQGGDCLPQTVAMGLLRRARLTYSPAWPFLAPKAKCSWMPWGFWIVNIPALGFGCHF